MSLSVYDGIQSQKIQTDRGEFHFLEKPGDGETFVLIHGNVSSSHFFQPLMGLLGNHRVIAPDLRGFGLSQTLPVDATRGVRDFSDDVLAVLAELGVERAHILGWSLGGGVAMQLALDAPEVVQSLTLEAPVSPYGFGGTWPDGRPLNDDASGTGGGAANPDFVARVGSSDTSSDEQTSPRNVYRSSYVKNPDRVANEDLWVASMLSTKTGVDNYPGDAGASEHWPGFGAGSKGVLNSLSPKHFNVSALATSGATFPVLWIRGDSDAIVNDASFFDLNQLGAVGIVPGWPGDEVAPAQHMLKQTRQVLEAYQAAGGSYREVVFEDCGHSPHLEYSERFAAELLSNIGS